MKLFEIKDLHKTYKIGEIDVKALRGVSFSIEEGEFLAIMGASGSGKSTLMHLLGLLDTPDQGTMHLLGKDITRLDEMQHAYLRNKVIGFVFQQFNLMTRSTAVENVMLPLFYSEDGKENQAKQATELLTRVGLADRLNHRPNELSGGQQQRVAIARALVNHPLLILADEPTGNLDSRSGKEVLDILKGLHEQGLTVVLVTHDEKVAEAAGRIIRMQDGQIIEDKKTKPLQASKHATPESLVNIPEKKGYSLAEFREHYHQAFRMIFSNKLRSFLSMLGVLIGVACVITMLALGKGARELITEQLARLGSNLLSVRPGSAKLRGVALEAGAITRFTLEDAKAIKESISSVKRVAPQVSGAVQLVRMDKNWLTQLVGSTPDYAPMKNQIPVTGRFFTDEENRARRRVALVGQTVLRELFGAENPVGQLIKINRVNFEVIGVLPKLGATTFRDRDDVVVIPLMTAMRRVLGEEYVKEIDVEIASLKEMSAAEKELRSLIVRRHRLPLDRKDSFDIRNFADVQAALTSTTKTFSVLLGCVAAISLVVGGIGIMNIMLVSVTERTREIGLRKAIGATKRDILMQFLVESVVITFIGGILGIVLAISVSWLIATLAKWKTVITIGSLLLAFIFSVAVGLIFGLWPAKQAADLDPIEALRYE